MSFEYKIYEKFSHGHSHRKAEVFDKEIIKY